MGKGIIMIRAIAPKDEQQWLALRTGYVTSTEMPALFDCSPYSTRFEVWHRKRDKTIIELEKNERMKWGLRLQSAIADGVAEEDGIPVGRIPEFFVNEDLRIGASFDFNHGPEGILEVKNVDSFAYREGWLVDEEGEVEAPPHIEIQVQQQLYLSKKKYAIIAALVGGNRLVRLHREPDLVVFKEIEKRAQEFWNTVDKGIEPEPDSQRDADLIFRMYAQAMEGKILDATDDEELESLARRYAFAAKQESSFEKEKKAIKAEILMRIGGAEKVIGNGFSISCGTVAAKLIESYERAAYRSFRVSERKSKEKAS